MKETQSTIAEKSIALHKKYKGKFAIASKVPVKNMRDLSLLYTPGVGAISSYLALHKDQTYKYTMKRNSIAVVSDGSAVLGLGNIGPEGALPVMEGKCVIFKKFANIDAIPIVLATQNIEKIVSAVKAIAPTFGGINLEDISAPRCFEIESRLKNELKIPVLHDDQHGTAIVVLAGLLNALKIVRKNISKVKIVISGAGAAGTALTKLLILTGAKQIVVCDSKGIINTKRPNLSKEKILLAKITNKHNKEGNLHDALKEADVFIGVSASNLLTINSIKSMAKNSIVFALANPNPEIMSELAKKGGARIIATGRSDYLNQLNNALVFPGVFRGALDNQVSQITDTMKLRAAHAIAGLISNPTATKIVPNIFDKRIVRAVAKVIK
ncbi:MAG: NADP-dependent malic enzyme [Patescibacteria group bacterium]